MDGCPDEHTLLAFDEDSLSQARRQEVLDHMVDCDACRRLVADLARLRDEARAQARPRAPAPILCRDLDPDAIAAARGNAEAAGVGADLQFEVAPLTTLTPPQGASGTLCTNPPYDERVRSRGRGKKDPMRELARVLTLFRGWQIAVLTPDRGLGHALGQRPAFTHRLYNGGIEVRLENYAPG